MSDEYGLMRAIRLLSVAVVVAMVAIISYGLASGGFAEEGSAIWALAWGKVTLVDLYVGLLVFAGWIAVRERRVLPTVIWWVGLVILGNLAAAVYLARAAFTSSNLEQMLTGQRAELPGSEDR